jgi:glycosyltransferase involved in cell wall biosynthesis
MKVGFFSPLPPAPSGVADYAAALLGALRKGGQVEAGAADADAALYHIGNNQLHRTIYERALARPGVAVLHDAVLQHLFLGMLGEARYTEEFVFNYGEWLRGLGEQLWRERARSAADPRYFRYPMLKRLAVASRAVIVHNPAAAREVRRHAPGASVAEIPHLFVPPELPAEVDTLRFRAELGVAPRTLLAGVFGHHRESKRLPVVVRALERAWQAGADAKLLIAGAFASSDLERSLLPRIDADPRILRAGRLPERDFWRYAAAADLCINLRFPTAAETSGIAVRMMGIGKPVIFTAGEEIARIPENACLRVDIGPSEDEVLSGYLLWLAGDREIAREIGSRAAAHIAKEHALDIVAERYWDVLRTS